nr:hypothetical protein CFP56_37134 [Quercus suber]
MGYGRAGYAPFWTSVPWRNNPESAINAASKVTGLGLFRDILHSALVRDRPNVPRHSRLLRSVARALGPWITSLAARDLMQDRRVDGDAQDSSSEERS